jgi:hypothetical protein
MSNAFNMKILLAILALLAAIAGGVAWQTHTQHLAQQKAEQQRKAFWDHYNSGAQNDPSISWGSAADVQGYKMAQPGQKKAK